jgi:hypothetical protein
MTRIVAISCMSLLAFSASARAQNKAPAAGAPDMTKVGPMSRPVTKEKEDKKGIEETLKAMEDGWKKGDVAALAELVDFPVIMLSDDSNGVAQHFEATREQWVGMMKGMAEGMPKDMKMSSKHNISLLSDTLAVVVSDNNMSIGKTKGKFKSFSVLNYKDGKWKVKQMAESGWGDMKPPSAHAAK